MALVRGGGKSTGGFSSVGRALAAAVDLRPKMPTLITRDPFLKHFRTDFAAWKIEVDGRDVPTFSVITAARGGKGYVDLFEHCPRSGEVLLDPHGQPRRTRVLGEVVLHAPLTWTNAGCASCNRKALQANKWWPG